MELKHLRKNKIQAISTQLLENELAKLETRQARYEKDIVDNEVFCKILFDRLCESGEGTSTWGGRHTTRDGEWSEDKEKWYELDQIIEGARHAIRKMQKKKDLIEIELTDRILTGH